MASITLKNIVKKYPGNVIAVKDFNLVIEDRRFIILVGPSGCGKSTTLRMIAGLEDITEGELYIGDRMVNNTPPKDRDIAMVFQNYALYPHMTVYKNMAFGLELRKIPKKIIKEKVEEAAKILDIVHLLNRRPKELSGGQRQRVALGRAMVRNPAVFLLDEPLSNLDAKLRAQMRTEIAKLHKTLGTTFVYVTHDQVEAMTMGDCIVVMKDGVIQQIGNPQNIYDHPCNLFVAGFIGTPQMNFIDASVRERKGKYCIEFCGNSICIPEGKAQPEVLKQYASKPVVMGIRPENIYCNSQYLKVNNLPAIKAQVELVEHLGCEANVYLSFNGQKLTARTPSNAASQIDEDIDFAFEPQKIHLFDKETEAIIFN